MEEANKVKPFTSKEADVLLKAPFVPQHRKKLPISTVPFKLQGDERSEKRRQFDLQVKIEAERREREEAERRKIEDEENRRKIRKATNFKANPNPFS